MKSKPITRLVSAIYADWAIVLTILVAVIATCAAILYASQPILECYGFRQTQTALTSYWMVKDGWKLAYETPVAGYPWSIPFEFPIYQSVVALVVYLFHFPLDATGRLISFGFLLACAWPAFSIARRLRLGSQVAWVFCALLWSSPIYLFWGRTFMIETTALFFTLAAIPYAIDMFGSSPRWKPAFLFAFFAMLGILQKVTTAAPVIMVLAMVLIFDHIRSFGLKLPTLRKTVCMVVAFLFPIAITMIWTNYSDFIKEQNLFGAHLTSKSLSGWNFGTFQQHYDLKILKTIFWDRVLLANAAGIVGVALLSISLFVAEKLIRIVLLLCCLMFVLPIFFFINLHYIHTYYQVSSTVFLISALAVSIVLVLPKKIRKIPFPQIATVLLVVSNFYFFSTNYAGIMRATFDDSKTDILAIGEVIRRYTPVKSGIVVFGADWSSEIGYYSERRSFTVPDRTFPGLDWYKEYDSVWQSTSSFLGELKLGAVVFCPWNSKRTLNDIMERSDVKLNPCLFKVNECFIWLPGVKSVFLSNSHRTLLPMDFFGKIFDSLPSGYTKAIFTNCNGAIDMVNGIFPAPEKIETSNFLSVEGWLVYSAKDGIAPDDIYITMKNLDGITKYITTNRKRRPDVNEAFKQPSMADVGYTTTIDIRNLKGDYLLGLALGYQGRLTQCEQFKMPLKIVMK